MERYKIVIIEDGNPDTQKIPGCLHLTRWTPEVLAEGMRDEAPALLLRTGCKALLPEETATVLRDAARGLRTALSGYGNPVLFMTTAGRPNEIGIIAEELGPFDAYLRLAGSDEASAVEEGPRFSAAGVQPGDFERLMALENGARCVIEAGDRVDDLVFRAVLGGKRFLVTGDAAALARIYGRRARPKHPRPSWDDYFLQIADAVAGRATCDRGRSGCVIVRDKSILVTGYVGSPAGLPHCDEIGHQMKKTIHEDGHVTQHCVRTVHAEQNAICQAARYGISLEGGTLYCRMTPCRTCAMLIINCGIKRVVCERRYHAGAESEEMFKAVGISLFYKYEEYQTYENQ